MKRILEGEEKEAVLREVLRKQGYSEEDIVTMLNQKPRKEHEMSNNMKYINSRETNKEVFQDTMKWISEETELKAAIEHSVANQFIWKQGEAFPVETCERTADKKTRIFTSPKRTFEAAEAHSKAGKKVAVLNFANNHHVGGGVWGGANAQEEALCRCSTLYSCISDSKMMEGFYKYHSDLFDRMEIDFTGNDDLIYTPDVVVCKTDAPVPERMEKKDWYKVDVITCAAPNLRGLWFEEEKEYEIHLARFMAILESAKRMNAEVVILGAFGCGAFANKPEIVSHAASDVLKNYEGVFETIEFAVFATSRDTRNYEEFAKVFGEGK